MIRRGPYGPSSTSSSPRIPARTRSRSPDVGAFAAEPSMRVTSLTAMATTPVAMVGAGGASRGDPSAPAHRDLLRLVRRHFLRQRDPDLQDAVLVRRRDVRLGHGLGQRQGARERATAKLTAEVALPLLLLLGAPLRGYPQQAVGHGQLDVLVRVDARQLGSDDERRVLTELVDPDHLIGEPGPPLHRALERP